MCIGSVILAKEIAETHFGAVWEAFIDENVQEFYLNLFISVRAILTEAFAQVGGPVQIEDPVLLSRTESSNYFQTCFCKRSCAESPTRSCSYRSLIPILQTDTLLGNHEIRLRPGLSNYVLLRHRRIRGS